MTKHRIITNGEKFRVETEELAYTRQRHKRGAWGVVTRIVEEPVYEWTLEREPKTKEEQMEEVQRAYCHFKGLFLGEYESWKIPKAPLDFNTYAQAVQWIRREYGKRAHIEPREWRPA